MDETIQNQRLRPALGTFLALLFVIFPITTAVIAARRWLPDLASQHGAGIDSMINYLLITVGSLFVIGHLVLAYFIWRYSRQPTITSRLAKAKTEWRWAVIPVIVMSFIAEGGVLVIGLPVWQKVYATKPPADALTLEVTAEQFVWNVRYPGSDAVFGRSDVNSMSTDNPLGLSDSDSAALDDIYLQNQLYLQVNKPVHVRLRSKDVIHSFFLPQHRVKQDAVPGMNMDIWFVPTQVGEFELACTELCGLGHYRMRGFVHVMEEEAFKKWLAEESIQSRYFR